MRRLRLDGNYQNTVEPQRFASGGLAYEPNLEEVAQDGINLSDYLIEEVNTPPLPMTPMPNPQVVQTQASGNIMNTGLTPAEQAYLSEEEKMIRLRNRGLA